MVQQVFLSHDSRDSRLARVIAETISKVSLRQIEVWYSSDVSLGGLKPGQAWISEIKSQLYASRAVMILLTSNSLYRPWLYFEGGFGFSKQDCFIIPICIGIPLSVVPNPLAIFQCYELNDFEMLKHFFRKMLCQLQVGFDEEIASNILQCAMETMKLHTPVMVNERARINDHTDVTTQLEICVAMMQGAYDDLPIMIHSIDETGVICEVNRKWLEVLGYQREEVIGKPADFLMTAESAELAMLVIIPEFWELGCCRDVPYQYKKKDGSIIDVLLNCITTTDKGGRRVSLSFVQDISNPQILGQHEELKLRYDQRLQNEAAGFYETDLFGNFTAINDYLSQLLWGVEKGVLVGMNFRDVVDFESAKSVFNAHHSVFTNRVSKKGNIWNLKTRDGRILKVQSNVSLVTTPSGKAIGFRGVVRYTSGQLLSLTS